MDVLSHYHRITTSFDIPGLATFPGYLHTHGPQRYAIWRDPARLADTVSQNYGGQGRYGNGNYVWVVGDYMFMDDVELGNNHLDNVTVPAKTNWLWCANFPAGQPGIWGWHVGYHAGGSSFSFIDGHAEIVPVKPLNDYWLATGGVLHHLQSAAEFGNYIYTYPPEMNMLSNLIAAKWWIPSHYSSGPVYDRY